MLNYARLAVGSVVLAILTMSPVAAYTASPVSPSLYGTSHSASLKYENMANLLPRAGGRICGAAGTNRLIPQGFGRADFTQECAWHDACYAHSSTLGRVVCDHEFRVLMVNKCSDTYPPTGRFDRNLWIRNSCKGAAFEYWQAVRTFGWSFYEGSGSRL